MQRFNKKYQWLYDSQVTASSRDNGGMDVGSLSQITIIVVGKLSYHNKLEYYREQVEENTLSKKKKKVEENKLNFKQLQLTDKYIKSECDIM